MANNPKTKAVVVSADHHWMLSSVAKNSGRTITNVLEAVLADWVETVDVDRECPESPQKVRARILEKKNGKKRKPKPKKDPRLHAAGAKRP